MWPMAYSSQTVRRRLSLMRRSLDSPLTVSKQSGIHLPSLNVVPFLFVTEEEYKGDSQSPVRAKLGQTNAQQDDEFLQALAGGADYSKSKASSVATPTSSAKN